MSLIERDRKIYTILQDMIKNEIGLVGFNCGYRHDQLARLTLPYARNVSAVEDELESESMRGQMTTGTLGFTPPT